MISEVLPKILCKDKELFLINEVILHFKSD